MSSTAIPPLPIAASTPTMRRTIFQMKCEPATRTRMRSPSSIRVTSSTRTSVDFSSGSSSLKAWKSCIPVSRAAAACMRDRSSGSRTHHTKGLANALRRRDN